MREQIILLETVPGSTKVATHSPLRETQSRGLYERTTSFYLIPAQGPISVTRRQEMIFLTRTNEWIPVRDLEVHEDLPQDIGIEIVPEERGQDLRFWLVSNN